MPERYHRGLVLLHWVMAVLIIVALVAGKLILERLDNADPDKLFSLTAHMSIGILVGALLVVRLVIRLRKPVPEHATTGNALLDRIGVATHWLLYLLVAVMVLSGLGMALGAGLFPITYGASGDAIPDTLQTMPPRAVHGLTSNLLFLLIALHIAAALYHQFVLRDGLLRRMGFGAGK